MAYKGIAAFAAMGKNFPVRRVLNAYPKNIEMPATAILYGLFGDSWKFPRAFCKKFADRPHLIQWHLCFRNPPTLKELRKRTRAITQRMQKLGNENTRIVICPVLEDSCTDKKFKRIVEVVKQAAKSTYPELEIVRNPYNGGEIVGPYDYEEHHGGNPRYRKVMRSRIYNPDGLSVDFKDGDKYFNRMDIDDFEDIINDDMFLWLIWYAPLQGFKDCSGWGDSPPISKRKYLLSRKAAKGMKAILDGN